MTVHVVCTTSSGVGRCIFHWCRGCLCAWLWKGLCRCHHLPAFPFTCWPASKTHFHFISGVEDHVLSKCRSAEDLWSGILTTHCFRSKNMCKIQSVGLIPPKHFIIGRSEDKTTISLLSFTQMDYYSHLIGLLTDWVLNMFWLHYMVLLIIRVRTKYTLVLEHLWYHSCLSTHMHL